MGAPAIGAIAAQLDVMSLPGLSIGAGEGSAANVMAFEMIDYGRTASGEADLEAQRASLNATSQVCRVDGGRVVFIQIAATGKFIAVERSDNNDVTIISCLNVSSGLRCLVKVQAVVVRRGAYCASYSYRGPVVPNKGSGWINRFMRFQGVAGGYDRKPDHHKPSHGPHSLLFSSARCVMRSCRMLSVGIDDGIRRDLFVS